MKVRKSEPSCLVVRQRKTAINKPLGYTHKICFERRPLGSEKECAKDNERMALNRKQQNELLPRFSLQRLTKETGSHSGSYNTKMN